MKTLKLAVIAVALCASAFAGTLIDSANIFGPKAADVSSALMTSPVSIETLERTPNGGLKAYADAHAAALDQARSFYVVITTNPREWRVSMNPVGIASAEGVRLAGEAMTAQFKRGHFPEGAIGLSHQLVALTQPGAEHASSDNSDFWWTVFWVILALVVIAMIVCAISSSGGGGRGYNSSSTFIWFGGSSGGDSGSSSSSSDSGSSSSDSSGGGGSW